MVMKNSSVHERTNTASRRQFLKSVGGATTVSFIGLNTVHSRAAELQKLDESDPTAVALKYVHDASKVSDSLRPQKDRYCYNCALYSGGKDDEWAGCSIFQGKSVAADGWCSVWAPKQQP
jgi:hypothetical protein